MNELTVRLQAPGEVAAATLESIKPEINAEIHGRSTVDLRYEGGELILHVSAKDLHAMRAAANTYIRWLDMCAKLTE